ncbi:toxic anion resistance protein [Paracoccus litorisediminis]|uniref:toxic anion resistance protein n=1 Tax=Paracoccus litorisediminis TaxID=2006130 RepID=UPI0037369CBF
MGSPARPRAKKAATLIEEVAGGPAIALEMVEAPAPSLPSRAELVSPLRKHIDADRLAEIEAKMAEIDVANTGSVLSFGAAAQAELQTVSSSMLAGVRNKDLGEAGSGLTDMVTALRGFSVERGDLDDKQGFLGRLMGKATPLMKFKARFETVEAQIEEIAGGLLKHQQQLLKDIAALDRLYAGTLSFFDGLALYIEAGELKIAEIDAVDLPAKKAEMEAAAESSAMILANELRELQALRDDLERRVHDMKLTRQVTMQSLPSIRLVQENDKSLIGKIDSVMSNTLPLWKTQLAQAITIQRSANAAKSLKAASDLTNELLTSNAANLRQANAAIRTEMERGVFDIDAIKAANAELIGTIEDSLRIADEGKTRRIAAETELRQMEEQLKGTLSAASARRVA